MLLGENITLALKSLKSNKMRAFLTMLGIIIGTASVIAIFTIGNSLTESVEENMQSIGANDVYVTVAPRSASSKRDPDAAVDGLHFGESGTSSFSSLSDISEEDEITADMVHDLADRFPDEIYAVASQMSAGSGSISCGPASSDVSLTGVSAGFFVTTRVNITAGSFLRPDAWTKGENVCMISEKTAETLFGKAADAPGQTVTVTNSYGMNEFTVSGVYEAEQTGGSSSSMMNMFSALARQTVYIPLKTAAAISHSKESFQYLQVIANVGVDTDRLAEKVSDFFEPYYRSNSKYHVTAVTLKSMVAMLEQLLGLITAAISIIAGIALLVGGIGVMNIMLVSVTERTREIGTRKALGATNASIRVQFIVEALIICLIGGLIGMALGMILGVAASTYLGYPARPSLAGVLLALGFSVGIGLFFGYFPANKAAKMNPIDALRYE